MNTFIDEKDWDALVRRNTPHMLRAAYAILHSADDAQDAVQDAFIKLLRYQPHFHDTEHEKAWLLRVTINIAKNDLRLLRRMAPMPLQEPAAVQEARSPVLEAVLALPDAYRIIIHLYYYEGYSIKEIAQIMRLPAATVGTRLARGRQKLAALLEGETLT
jgi:RNA polymerase sigma-70 factor (ECF subfamily)